MAELLVAALRQEEFVLYGQEIRPLKPAPDARPIREVLVRFQQEEERLIPPGTFFPVLEEQGLLAMLDRWVVATLIKRLHAALQVRPDWKVPCNTVNLCLQAIQEPGFRRFVARHLEVSGIAAGSIAFEIPWSMVTAHATAIHAFMTRLRRAGCAFVFSGFDGTEEAVAGLRYLKPDFVKISTRLIQQVLPSATGRAAVQFVHRTCNSLGIETIAEQVEDAAAIEPLRELGIDYVQGFAVSHPQPIY